jgi:hypothetical protein
MLDRAEVANAFRVRTPSHFPRGRDDGARTGDCVHQTFFPQGREHPAGGRHGNSPVTSDLPRRRHAVARSQLA